MKPFLYVAGLFRSGTTLVQELLTEKDISFIFHEPRFGDGWWQFQQYDRAFLKKDWGVELPEFESTGDAWAWFEEREIQIGVKEVRNQSGQFYGECWQGNMRFIVVERDPYEIYLSCYKMIMRNSREFMWHPRYSPLTPLNLYREVIDEIRNINKIWEMTHSKCRFVADYKRICEGDHTDLYFIAESGVMNPSIGAYHSVLPRGKYENKTHGDIVTTKSLSNSVDVPKPIIEQAIKFRELTNREKSWLKN